MRTIILFIFMLMLSGCETDKDIICGRNLNISNGDLELMSRQCIDLTTNTSRMTIGLYKFRDKKTNKVTIYTVNAINDKIVFNLSSGDQIAIQTSDNASMMAAVAVGMSAGSRR